MLKLDPNLGLVDSWAPTDWRSLDSGDADIGSSMPVLLPGNLVFEDGKSGLGYLLDSTHLGGVSNAVFSKSVCASFGGGIYVNGVIYVACSNGLRALSLDTTHRTFAALPGWTVNGSAEGPPIFAGGLVWSAGTGNGILYGLDPASGATKFSADLGGFQHFTTPSAGGGDLFVANHASSTADRVTAFRIANSPAPTPTPTPPPKPPAISKLHAKVVGRKLRIGFNLSEAATVTIRLGQRKWTRHARPGHDSFLLRWRKLSRGRHRVLLVASDAAGHRSKRYSVRFRYRPKARLSLF